MREHLHKILAIAGLVGCGEKAATAKITALDINPANLPVRSECLGLDVTGNQGIPVDWDDQAPLRVCLMQQADGALAFDIRLRTETPSLRRQDLNVEIRGANGRSAAGVFPLLWNPFNGIYELQLSQGCLVGAPAGCAVTAPAVMRHLFTALPQAEGGWHPEVQMHLSFIQDEGKPQSDSPRFSFYWPSNSTELEKSVN